MLDSSRRIICGGVCLCSVLTCMLLKSVWADNSSNAASPELLQMTLSDVFAESSWNTKASEIPAESVAVWLDKNLSALAGEDAKCIWRSEKLEDAEVQSCLVALKNTEISFDFVKRNIKSAWSFLPSQPDLMFRMGRLDNVQSNALRVHERLSFPAKEGKKGIAYSWSGCFQNSGPSEIENIHMRLWLMLSDTEGQRLQVAGRERKHTPRSGIPRKLAPGEFFCTDLDVKGVPVEWEKKKRLEASVLIDSTWYDSRGFPHVGPIMLKELDLSVLSGVDVKKTAIIVDAAIYSSKPGKIIRRPHPEALIFTVDRQEGRWLHGTSSDEVSGWIKADNAWSVFEDAPPLDERSEFALDALKNILRSIVDSGCQRASKSIDAVGALDCASSVEHKERIPVETELLFRPFKIKVEDTQSVGIEVYFGAKRKGRAGRLHFADFVMNKEESSDNWKLAAGERSMTVLSEFVRDCLPEKP